MLRPLGKILGLAFLLGVASVGAWYYQHAYSTEKKIEKLEDEKRQLEQVVTRLTSDKRVADVVVSRQERNERGVLETTLLFVEYDKNGDPLPARSFTFEGDRAHIDAMVIKFDRGFVAENDPLRGHSIALFTRLFGEHQTPAQGAMIDTPGKIPDIYRGASPTVTEFEMSLWRDFWKLYEDESFRAAKGVRVLDGASPQSVWGPFKPGLLYTITLQADDGISMTASPIKGIYREAMKQRTATTAPSRG